MINLARTTVLTVPFSVVVVEPQRKNSFRQLTDMFFSLISEIYVIINICYVTGFFENNWE